ncbi:MAG: pyruvate dehydrogenase (acetyl-transferring), homodimeric type [Candidatus Marinimicrobia bacterium]|nr:pyruvate dehydrogenase (acetyl-transferring), homodimeric type [Candidatus Neomarinimicrobiota bacterium]
MAKDDKQAMEIERREWMESLDYVLGRDDPGRVRRLLRGLRERAHEAGVDLRHCANTPYINTIPAARQPVYPGDRDIERRIKSIIRWNAMAMVVRANRAEAGIGGHISTYASQATLYEVGFNHFFRAAHDQADGDHVYFQGHASPGNYARAFLEGRISIPELKNFRHECHDGPGLPSYPHPWLKPDFWQFPTVSMGLGPIQAIYHARFDHYLADRGLKDTSDHKVWCFVGDGETDEPESLGAISLAGRERLDNLIFVVNCNLQRLDGPVRGNSNIIQELETGFLGAGWHVIKVIWGADMDPLLEKDQDGILVKTLGEIVDGEHQNYTVKGGAYVREHLFGRDPRLLKMVEQISDEDLGRLRLGGHDPDKVYAAYQAAVRHTGSPTVILARTIKGYGLGEAGEGRNITHQQKKLNEKELREFRTRFAVPVSDADVDDVPFYKPDDDTPEMQYLHERRRALGGYLPARRDQAEALEEVDAALFEEFHQGSGDKEVATTMAFGRILSKLLKDEQLGPRIVPIIPDEARTFGLDALFRQVGIYAHAGQLYEPVDRANLLYYREAQDGQILEEGITEAGSMSSFIAAGTAYANHRLNMIPFFMFYSMFGLQRVGDLIWAAGDIRARGFLVGGTAGRTTLAGEGLQHCDGNSHLLAFPHPTVRAYDPAYAYEIAVIVQDGIRRMVHEQQDEMVYFTIMNETYRQPAMPKDVTTGILKGIYRLRAPLQDDAEAQVHLFGSGAILNEAIKAQALLAETFDVAADVWSVTSYKALYHDAVTTERWNRLHPGRKPKTPYLVAALKQAKGPFVAATDYHRLLPESIANWLPHRLVALGTDGFGRSDGRTHLRAFFEVDERHIALAALQALTCEGAYDKKVCAQAIKKLGIAPEKPDPINT